MQGLEWVNNIGIVRSAIGPGAKYQDILKYENR